MKDVQLSSSRQVYSANVGSDGVPVEQTIRQLAFWASKIHTLFGKGILWSIRRLVSLVFRSDAGHHDSMVAELKRRTHVSECREERFHILRQHSRLGERVVRSLGKVRRATPPRTEDGVTRLAKMRIEMQAFRRPRLFGALRSHPIVSLNAALVFKR